MQRMKMEVRQFGVMVGLLLAWLMVPIGAVHAETKGELLQLEQIELKQTHIDGYLKIAPKLVKMFDRIDKANGEPDKQLSADLEALAKEGGFQSFDELETVVSNITFVMSGINDEDGSFKEPVEVLKEELAETEADQNMKGDEKKQLITSIKESIAHTPKLKHTGNIALVKKHFKELAKLFEE